MADNFAQKMKIQKEDEGNKVTEIRVKQDTDFDLELEKKK